MEQRRLSRRDLLQGFGGAACALALSACAAPAATPPAATTAPAPKPTTGAAPTSVPAAQPTATAAAKPTAAAAAPTTAPATASKVTLRFWDFQQSDKSILDAQQKALSDFQKANPNIEVQIEVTPITQYRDKLLVATRGGNPPDIATLDQIWSSEFAASGSIIPVDDYINSAGLKRDTFFGGAWDSNVWQGKTWGIPLNNDVWQELYYNTALFEQAGLDPSKPPATWTELADMSKKLTKAPDVYGLALYGVKSEVIAVVMDSWIYSNGGKIIDDAGKAALINSPESVAALEHYVSLLESAPPGTPNREEGESINLFTSGKVAMGLFGSWQQDTIKQRGPDMKWDLAMCPAPDGKQFRGTLGGWSMSIFKASKNPEAAWKYVEFLTHKDVQKTVNSLIPARNDAGKEFVEALRKRPDVILKTVDTGLPRPISPVYPQISEVQQSMMQDIWANKQVKPAADKAAKDIEKVLQS